MDSPALITHVAGMALNIVLLAAVALSPYRPLEPAKPSAAAPICQKGERMKLERGASSGVAKLPFAMGRTFASLDEYLEHLACNAGPIGMPWWREIRPGVFEHVKTNTGATPEVATRAELAKRFGFDR